MFAVSLNDYTVAQFKREADLELLQRPSREQNIQTGPCGEYALYRENTKVQVSHSLPRSCVTGLWNLVQGWSSPLVGPQFFWEAHNKL